MFLDRRTTLVVITRDQLIRATFNSSRARRPAQFQSRSRPDIDHFPSLVSAALELDRRPPGRVFVLSSDFWTHTLELSIAQLGGVSDHELAQMLNFEAELTSHIDA